MEGTPKRQDAFSLRNEQLDKDIASLMQKIQEIENKLIGAGFLDKMKLNHSLKKTKERIVEIEDFKSTLQEYKNAVQSLIDIEEQKEG